MKRLLAYGFFLLIISVYSCNSGFEGTVITAEIKHAENKLFYLEDVATPEKIVVDSARVKDGVISMKVYINEGIYRLRETESDKMIFLYISESTDLISIQWDLKQPDKYIISGNQPSKDIKRIVSFTSQKARHWQTLDSLATHSNINSDVIDSLKTINRTIVVNYVKRMADSIPNADVAAFALNYMGVSKDQITYLVSITERLHKMNPKARYADVWYKALSAYRTEALKGVVNGLQVGTKAPLFALPDIYGDSLRLSDYKGKYVLLDFWASWCQPCRKENPNIVEAYKRFRKRNFMVVSISLDGKQEQWEQGVKVDKLVWRSHASDLLKWRSPIVQLYEIKGIPANFLLDTNGIIIARDLQSEALLSFLNDLLPQESGKVRVDSVRTDSLKIIAPQVVKTPAAVVNSAKPATAPASASTPSAIPKPLPKPVQQPVSPVLKAEPKEEPQPESPF